VVIDEVIGQVVARYWDAFAGRQLSCYLIGSYADGTANRLSDIDLVMVAVGWKPAEADRGREQAMRAALPADPRVDVALIAEAELAASRVGVNVKLGSVLIEGEDVRGRLALPPLPVYRRQVVAGARHFIGPVLRGAEEIALPLAYPEADDEFFGYARTRIAAWYPPAVEHGLKEWVTAGTRIATALVGLRGNYVGSKAEAIRLYAEVIGDAWADDLAVLYGRGKGEWGYLLPEDEADRQVLRGLAERFLGLERRFLKEALPATTMR
jgi:hypothetical protein